MKTVVEEEKVEETKTFYFPKTPKVEDWVKVSEFDPLLPYIGENMLNDKLRVSYDVKTTQDVLFKLHFFLHESLKHESMKVKYKLY